jgi:hypothetical protein
MGVCVCVWEREREMQFVHNIPGSIFLKFNPFSVVPSWLNNVASILSTY